MMVRDFQSVIGDEAKAQLQEAEGRLPDVGGRLHRRRLERDGPVPSVPGRPVGAADRRRGRRPRPRHRRARRQPDRRPARRAARQPHLSAAGRRRADQEAHSISAGLDYPGIGPEHSWLHDIGRVEYVAATDDEALEAFQLCTRTEGIIPALEPAHALAHVTKLAPTMDAGRDHPDESLRPRRQGHLHRGRASRA